MNDRDLLFKAAETLRAQIQSRDEERMSTNRVYTPEEIESACDYLRWVSDCVSPSDKQRTLDAIAIIEQLRSERDEAKRDHQSCIDTCKPGYVGNKVLAWTPCCPKNKPCPYHGEQRR